MKIVVIFITIFLSVVFNEGKKCMYRETTKGKCCVFPFIYKGKTYTDCTSARHYGSWCSLTAIYDKDEEWGKCKAAPEVCKPKDDELVAVHKICLSNWKNLYEGGATVEKLKNQCPHFCRNKDKNCVGYISCLRCQKLSGLCNLNENLCKGYLEKNKGQTECPQYELCKPGAGHMAHIRHVCEYSYRVWEFETDNGITLADLSNICSEFCRYQKKDCGWNIACRKCKLFVGIKSRPALPKFKNDLKIIMAKEEGDRCNHYQGDTFPYWWISGDLL